MFKYFNNFCVCANCVYTAQKMEFSITDFPVNVTKYAGNSVFGHIY